MKKKIFSFFLALAASVGMSWAQNPTPVTRTWSEDFWRTVDINGLYPERSAVTHKGITATVTKGANVKNEMLSIYQSGGASITFSADVNITSIVITTDWYSGVPSTGWNVSAGTGTFTFTWSGTPATSVTLTTGNAEQNLDMEVLTIVFTIEAEDKEIVYSAQNFDGNYDGEAHGITVNVTDPASGYTVKYGETKGTYDLDALTFTNVGEYTVYYRISADGYLTADDSAKVTIHPAGSRILLSTGFEEDDCLDGWILKNNGESDFGRQEYSGYARTGEYYFQLSSWHVAPNNDQYIITPEFNADYLKMAFYARSSYRQISSCENFRFGYSTTDTAFASFTWGDDIVVNTDAYTQYVYEAPAGTKFIAIKLTTPGEHENLRMDDLTIRGISQFAKLEDNTEDSAHWHFTPVSAPTYGVLAGQTVTLNYDGVLKVNSVTSSVAVENPSDNTWTLTQPEADIEIAVAYYPIAVATTNPTAVEGAKAGLDNELITAGESAEGTFQYAIGENSTEVPATGWSTDIPTAAAIDTVGDVYVWYQLIGDATHSNDTARCLTVSLGAPTLVFEDTYLGTRKEVDVVLPHKFVSDFDTDNGEWDQILKTLYSFYGWCRQDAGPKATGNEAVTAGLEGNNHYVLITGLFEGTATVTGGFSTEFPLAEDRTYTVTISIKESAPTAIDEIGNGERAKGEWTKVLRNGQILIIRDGKTYNALGAEVK